MGKMPFSSHRARGGRRGRAPTERTFLSCKTRVATPRQTPPAPEAAWARRLAHGPGPPRQAAAVLVQALAYRTGEKAAGTSSLLACRIGRTPVWGGHAPPD